MPTVIDARDLSLERTSFQSMFSILEETLFGTVFPHPRPLEQHAVLFYQKRERGEGRSRKPRLE
jgi:hypothetical protein